MIRSMRIAAEFLIKKRRYLGSFYHASMAAFRPDAARSSLVT